MVYTTKALWTTPKDSFPKLYIIRRRKREERGRNREERGSEKRREKG
jgi:hypothetical protein